MPGKSLLTVAERPRTKGMEIRSVTRADGDAWLKMRLDLWPDEEREWHAREVQRYFEGKLARPLNVLIAIGPDERALGFAELSIRPYAEGCLTDRVAFLEGWYVVADARRQGIGRTLVEAAERWARRQGCSEFGSDALIDNEVSAVAHAALGFEEVEQIRCFRKGLADST